MQNLQIVDPDHFFWRMQIVILTVSLLILQIVVRNIFLYIMQIVSLDHIVAILQTVVERWC